MACGSKSSESGEGAGASGPSKLAPTCEPAVTAAAEILPHVDPKHLTLEFWLEHLGKDYDLDQVLLTPVQIRAMNAALALPRDKYHAQRDLLGPADLADLAKKVEDRRVWARDKLAAGEFVREDGVKFEASALAAFEHQVAVDGSTPELRVALEATPVRCSAIPDGFFSPALDLRLDRNSCSSVRPQEPLRVIRAWPNGMKLVQAAYTYGWISGDAPLSPPIPDELQEAFVRGAAVRAASGIDAGDIQIAAGTLLPAADERGRTAHVATTIGFAVTAEQPEGSLQPMARGLSRRMLLEEAWRLMGTPYGLGGTGGGRDCSRLVLDVFDTFDLHLPRHSSWQSKAGSFWIAVEDVPEAERLLLIDSAAEKGIVLLHFPGHIMLYLGRNELGDPMVLHAFGEYLEPCANGGERLVRVPDITVSNLELGRGTSRTAFIERINQITVIGRPPGVELAGVAQVRPVSEAVIPADKKCKDSRHAALYVMPERPNKHQPLRVVAALSEDPGPAAMTLIDPKGNRLTPASVRLGGPPFGFVTTIQDPMPGTWKAVLADGENVIACQRIKVRGRRPKLREPSDGPIWNPRYRWHHANENLYALFVERLLDYSIDEDKVWPNLHTLLRDPDRNILYDYRGLDEDNEVDLVPDCADLPYTLRAYFAWKIRLPFGYRRCTRARPGRPPDCDRDGAGDNLMSRLELKGRGGNLQPRDDIEAFQLFFTTRLRRAVHSSSGRTAPADDLTDLYPVELSRQTLRPGTVFTDPYGHLLVVADWIPQGTDKYGILVGVDAQPDGTVGRRRFWRGSFLFHPDTESGGAGFKVFRPRELVREPVEVEIEVGEEEFVTVQRIGYFEEVINEDLRRSRRYPRFSLEQYKGTTDDFYDRMESLINPRPLDAAAMQVSLADALMEAVSRRVTSVNNGEKWIADHPGELMEMPEGASIFLTSGPWEDFSTPSRDLRLLIAIDSVVGFPRQVRASPERFGVRADELEEKLASLDKVLADALAARSFTYKRSDGGEQKLTLADVVARAELFEMAYNPNDCIEIRWSAEPGSDEMSTCDRHAPAEHRSRMDSYREWFSSRKRPAN